MPKGKILLAIEAMSELDRMADVAKEHGHHLIVLAEDPNFYGTPRYAEVIEFPTRDHKALADYIRNRRKDITQVFSLTSTWGVIASELRDEFGFPQIDTTEKLRNIGNKEYVHRRLVSAGMASNADSWPRIFKPRSGTGKLGVHLIANETEYQQVFGPNSIESSEDFLAQAFYAGPMYSAEVWQDSTDFVFFGVTNRILSQPPDFTEKVKSFPWAYDTAWEERVKEWVFWVLECVDYHFGHAHVEFIETSTGFELVEINARMAGALITPGVLATTNYDPYRFAVEQALGVPLKIPAQREVTGGFSHVSIYANQAGTLLSVEGTDQLDRYPGNIQWHPSKKPGTTITELGTYRARIGNLSAQGPTAAIAQDRAITAAAGVVAKIG